MNLDVDNAPDEKRGGEDPSLLQSCGPGRYPPPGIDLGRGRCKTWLRPEIEDWAEARRPCR